MNELFKLVLSLSVSGGLLILLLLACKPLWKKRAGKRWQYYIWLVVVVRLLLPFAPETSLMGAAFRQADAAAAAVDTQEMEWEVRSDTPLQAAAGAEALPAAADEPAERAPIGQGQPAGGISLREALALVRAWAWLVWLLAALALLVRKVVLYRSYVRYIRAGGEAVDDPALLDQLAQAGEQVGEQVGVRRPVELCVNGLVSSPMVVGVLRPCIVLPTLDLPAQEMECTLLHELTHCRRWDALYKWLVQLALCVHWFNPLVYCMEREISRACELSCDEAVIRRMDAQDRRAYGDTLLDAVAIGGGYLRPPAAATLHESKDLLKERLEAIAGYQKDHRPAVLGGLAAALALLLCACGVGAYRPFGVQTQTGTGGSETATTLSAAGQNDGGQQTAPGAVTITQTVQDIEIDWVSGEVEIGTYAGDSVAFIETADRALDSSTRLYYTLDGGTLHIQFTRDEKTGTQTLNDLHKTLTIRLPRSLELDGLAVDTLSADVTVNGAKVADAALKTTSGTVWVSNAALSGTLRLETSSGDVYAGPTGARRVEVSTMSGDVDLTEDNAATDLNISTMSGDARLILEAEPSSCNVSTMSGDTYLALPQGAGFGARATTMTGRITSDFAMQSTGKTCTVGNARNEKVNVSTMSGDISLRAAD